jgi:hypothetical protein
MPSIAHYATVMGKATPADKRQLIRFFISASSRGWPE